VITLREARLLRIVDILRTGNPYHDEKGKFTSGPGGDKEFSKKKQALIIAQKDLLRERLKNLHDRLKSKQYREWQEMWAKFRRERAKVNKQSREEKKQLIAKFREEKKAIQTPEQHKLWQEKAKKEKAEYKHNARERAKNISDQQAKEAREQKERFQAERQELKVKIKEHVGASKDKWSSSEFNEVVHEWEPETHEKEKYGLRSLNELTRKLAFPATKIHKASSAESILRHCLKTKGWTSRYRHDKLTGKQLLALLEEVRLYARAWLRHEASQFAGHYFSPPEFSGGVRKGLLGGSGDAAGSVFIGEVQRARIPASTNTEATPVYTGLRAHLGRFFGRVKQFVRESIVAGVMALLGPGPLTGEELEAADRHGAVQEQYFDKFEGEMVSAPEPMSAEKFIARTESYGNATYADSQEVHREMVIGGKKFDRERRVHRGADQPCDGCMEELEKHWQPIGTLRRIGSCECLNNCHCHFVFKLGEHGKEYMLWPRAGILQKLEGPIAGPPGV
jgi:hypothetical protein